MSANVLTDEQVKQLTEITGSFNSAVNVVMQVKRMTREAADKWLRAEWPDIDDTLVQALVELITEDHFEINMPRGKQYAILWLCGTTYGQLAQMYGVSRETAYAGAARYLTSQHKRELTPNRSKFTNNIEHVMVSALRQILNEWLVGMTHFKLMTQGSVSAIATAIMHEYNERQREFTEDSPSPYDTLFDSTENRLPEVETGDRIE